MKLILKKNNPNILNSKLSFHEGELWIDFVDGKEIFIMCIVCFAILISLIYFTFQIKPQILYQQFSKSYLSIQRTSLRRELMFKISPISSYNNFARIYISFERRNTTKNSIFREIKLDYLVRRVNESQHKMETFQHKILNCKIDDNKNISQKFIIFNDYLIDYKFLNLDVVVQDADNATFSKFIIDIYYGSDENTSFKIYFSIIFDLFFIFYIIFLVINTSSHCYVIISPILSLLVILANNPFMQFLSLYIQEIFYMCNAIYKSVCDTFIFFSTFIYLDLYFIRNNLTNCKNFGQKTLIILLFTSFYFIFTFIDEITNLKYNILSNFPSAEIVNYLNQIEKSVSISKFLFCFCEFFMIILKIAFCPIKNASLHIYFILSLLSFLKLGLISGLLKFICLYEVDTYERRSVQLNNADFIIQNIFSLLACYVHWPYKKREKIIEIDNNNQLDINIT